MIFEGKDNDFNFPDLTLVSYQGVKCNLKDCNFAQHYNSVVNNNLVMKATFKIIYFGDSSIQ